MNFQLFRLSWVVYSFAIIFSFVFIYIIQSDKNWSYLYYIKQYFLYVRGLFAPTGHSFQDTDIGLILFDPE